MAEVSAQEQHIQRADALRFEWFPAKETIWAAVINQKNVHVGGYAGTALVQLAAQERRGVPIAIDRRHNQDTARRRRCRWHVVLLRLRAVAHHEMSPRPGTHDHIALPYSLGNVVRLFDCQPDPRAITPCVVELWDHDE